MNFYFQLREMNTDLFFFFNYGHQHSGSDIFLGALEAVDFP